MSASAASFNPVGLWVELKNVALPGRASAGFGVLFGLRKFGLFAIIVSLFLLSIGTPSRA
jgi:hypothetical protein